MRELLDQKLARYEELELQLVDPDVLSHPNRLAAAAREHGSLTRIVTKYRRLKELNQQIAEARGMLEGEDEEFRQLAQLELPTLQEESEAVWNEMLELTIGGEDSNRSRCVMEIRAGTGGDEAALFARDLFEMYKRHCEARGWKFATLNGNPTELGGLKEISVSMEGEAVFREMQYESGGHRVQRVPTTEAQGRIHTSAATVAVLPEPEDVEINLKPGDYRKDIYHASGPGGQHVNKTASAVRLTHLKTNVVVAIQDEKSQHKNLAKALRVLKARLYEAKRQEEHKKRADQRKSLVGSGDRSQRIRTYNFPQNRVTDHRINFTLYSLDQVMAGHVQPLTDALLEYERQQQRDAMDISH